MEGGFILENGLISRQPDFPLDKFGNCFPDAYKENFLFEATSISMFPMEKHIMPTIGGGGGDVTSSGIADPKLSCRRYNQRRGGGTFQKWVCIKHI